MFETYAKDTILTNKARISNTCNFIEIHRVGSIPKTSWHIAGKIKHAYHWFCYSTIKRKTCVSDSCAMLYPPYTACLPNKTFANTGKESTHTLLSNAFSRFYLWHVINTKLKCVYLAMTYHKTRDTTEEAICKSIGAIHNTAECISWSITCHVHIHQSSLLVSTIQCSGW